MKHHLAVLVILAFLSVLAFSACGGSAGSESSGGSDCNRLYNPSACESTHGHVSEEVLNEMRRAAAERRARGHPFYK